MDKISELGRTEFTTDVQIYNKKAGNLKKFVAQTETQHKKALEAIDLYEKKALATNEKQFKDQIITQETYENELLSITQQGAERRVRVQEQFIGQQLANIAALKETSISLYKEATIAIKQSYKSREKTIQNSYEKEREALEIAHNEKMTSIKEYTVNASESENVLLAEHLKNTEAKKVIAQKYWSTITRLHQDAFAAGIAVDETALEKAVLQRDVEMSKLEGYHKKRLSLIQQNNTEILSASQQRYIEEDRYRQAELTSINAFTKDALTAVQERSDGEIRSLEGSQLSEEESANERLRILNEFNASVSKINDERLSAYQKLMSDLLSEEAKLSTSIKKHQKSIIKAQKTLADFERKLSRDKLTEKEKYYADVKRAAELNAQALQELEVGNSEKAIEYYEQARAIGLTLGKEVKETKQVVEYSRDSVGKLKTAYKDKQVVVIDGAKAEKDALDIVTLATKGLEEAHVKAKKEEEERLVAVQEQYKKLKEKVEEYQTAVLAVSDIKIDIDTSGASESLDGLISQLQEAVRLQDKLGRGGGGGGSDFSDTVPQDSPGYATGGQISGIDRGYDSKNIKARPGEWVIKNKAVDHWKEKFGSGFMNGINNPTSAMGAHINQTLTGENAFDSKSFIKDFAAELAGVIPQSTSVSNSSNVAVNFGEGSLAPRGQVQSRAEALINEVRRVQA